MTTQQRIERIACNLANDIIGTNLHESYLKIITALTAFAEENEKTREAYNELIFAVGDKYEGETRHQTALRYIIEAETKCHDGPFSAPSTGEKPE